MGRIVKIKVKDGARAPFVMDDTIVIYTKAKHENNQANRDVLRQLSEFLHTDVEKIRILRGKTRRNKVISIDD